MARPTLDQLAFGRIDSPLGALWAAVDGGDRLVALDRDDQPRPLLASLSRRFPGADVVPEQGAVAGIRDQLGAYFGRRLRRFRIRVGLDDLPAFDRRVLEACMRIPYGTTATYGELAAIAGAPRAARAVGGALSRCPVAVVVPCHRVLRASGGIGGWGGDIAVKRWLLELEDALPLSDAAAG
jgi:methylated-DNA-[protein]-cysteine S-methyltransferase